MHIAEAHSLPKCCVCMAQEVDAFDRDTVEAKDLPGFPYADACIRESLRLYPPGHITARCPRLQMQTMSALLLEPWPGHSEGRTGPLTSRTDAHLCQPVNVCPLWISLRRVHHSIDSIGNLSNEHRCTSISSMQGQRCLQRGCLQGQLALQA